MEIIYYEFDVLTVNVSKNISQIGIPRILFKKRSLKSRSRYWFVQ